MSFTPAIFISASVPDPRRDARFFRTGDTFAIRDSLLALAEVFAPDFFLVFGGHPAITPLVARIAETLHLEERFVVYQSLEFEDEFPVELESLPNVIYTKKLENSARSLEQLRFRMLHDSPFQAAFFLGGMDGVLAEYELLSTLPQRPHLFPIATTGGAAGILAEQYRFQLPDIDGLTDTYDYVTLFRRIVRFLEESGSVQVASGSR